MPTSRPAQPPCRTSATTPYAAATDSRFITAALTATATLRNDDQQQEHREQHHAADEQRDPLGDVVGAVDRRRGDAADVDASAGAGGRRRQHGVAQRGARGPRSSASCGPVVGTTVSTAVSPAGLSCAGESPRRPRASAQRGGQLRRAAVAPAPVGQLGDQQQRAVGARRRTPAASGRTPAGWRCPARSLPASGKPKRTPRNGAASASRIATPGSAAATRWRSTSRLQRSQPRDGSTWPPAATATGGASAAAGAAAGRSCRPR